MILVTGATGTVGTDLIRRLAGAEVPVRALVRNPNKAATIATLGVEIVYGDMQRPDTLDAASAGVEVVFLLSREEPRQVELQSNMISAAKRAGVRHVVKLSALGAALDSPLVGCRWHAQTERELEASGIAFTHLRPNFFMQNFALYSRSLANGTLRVPMGDGRISMIDARDVAAVAATVLTQPGHEGKIYELTGPEALSFSDAADQLSEVMHRPIEYVDVTFDAARAEMIAMGLSEWRADWIVDIYRVYRSEHGEQVTSCVADITGDQPRTFRSFAQELSLRISS